MIKIALFFFVFVIAIAAQQENKRWAKIHANYEIKNTNQDAHQSIGESDFLGGAHGLYKYLISDLDGDNCPFSPSCSNFFIQAAQQTNLIKASLMFADRFMRDTNFFNREDYIKNPKGKLIDKVENYK